MESIEKIEILSDLCKEYNIELPQNLQTRAIYKEIENFKDSEYIYCIAYEMLIRTDEYNTLLNEYESLKNKSIYNMTNDEFSKFRELINKMNGLGLKKTSFLGFDCDNDNDHVFKRIEYYDEVMISPWNVRMLHKFQLDPSLGYKSIFHMLINFYNKKNKLYILKNGKYNKISLEPQNTQESNQTNFINDIHITEINKIVDKLFIPYIINGNTKYKALKDIVYLKELDKDFLSQLKERQSSNLLIQTKSDFSHDNTEFWNKYYINDIKGGLDKLIEFHLNNNLIYDQNIKHADVSKNEILENPSNFYIPCVNRLIQSEIYPLEKINNLTPNNEFEKGLELDGLKSMVRDKGYITLRKEENIYLVQISKYISLSLLEKPFLETLTYQDLKNIYIDTEPIFSRPRLMFDEARLTNIPINLNLSKEDLLFYISQIKDDYDRDKNIVKNNIEYFFDLTIESDLTEMPTNIKYVDEKAKIKRLFPNKRKDFKKRLASAFYIYDIYKFFLPFFKKKIKSIRDNRESTIDKIKETAKKEGTTINQIAIEEAKESAEKEFKNYENNNLITQISYLVQNLSEEQVEYYLTTLKEFIHGVNKDGENNPLKKQYDPNKCEQTTPKYKNLIIGDSYIIKSNKSDLIKSFGL